MVERMIPGRELTVGLLAGESGQLGALPIVEVISSSGVYDYEAKYTRGDTRYVVDPELPAGLADALHTNALALAAAIGVRHLSRVDFMQDDAGRAWLLEVNTMPGFTPASLLPKAAAATGLDLPGLASRLVRLAKDVREV
jgi:D-alanine-D-alanine ligase